jgi:hypothetical protein
MSFVESSSLSTAGNGRVIGLVMSPEARYAAALHVSGEITVWELGTNQLIDTIVAVDSVTILWDDHDRLWIGSSAGRVVYKHSFWVRLRTHPLIIKILLKSAQGTENIVTPEALDSTVHAIAVAKKVCIAAVARGGDSPGAQRRAEHLESGSHVEDAPLAHCSIGGRQNY